APLRRLPDGCYVLELFHGPTCAFKDMALQLMPRLLVHSMERTQAKQKTMILVATSGDTGKAALEGFCDVPGTRIMVFYPANGVSEVQERQMTTQRGKNVAVVAINGNFDDAQTAVKALFADRALAQTAADRGWTLSSANSHNWGRLLPQIVYYVYTSAKLQADGVLTGGKRVSFVVPTGNFGNILACWYAKHMGAPIGRIVCASNANDVLTEFIQTGVYDRSRPFHRTISPSMDILVSSNLERLLFELTGHDAARVRGYMQALTQSGRYEIEPALLDAIRADFSAARADDDATRQTLARIWREDHYLCDPHTAVAFDALRQTRGELSNDVPVVVSTASPFKFASDVLSALSETAPNGFAALDRLSAVTGISVPAPLADLAALQVLHSATVDVAAVRGAVERFLKV
ncbi:MAG: threonine synthase, partial [Oscillospiraceae bacterium]|nr:threonine synthase [Oscillospiraceae bacterium]